MKIAVTGGHGFIGSATVRYAQQRGHSAWSFDRHDGHDITDPDTFDGLKGADVVIHLAGVLGTAELFDDAHAAIDMNIHGALNVLQWCEKNGAGYVGITMPPVFPSVYTATKICADRLATAWHLSRGVPVSRVRAFNAYGPGQKYGHGHPQKILPTFSTLAWEGKPITVWGDGEQTVDLVHTDDVAAMLISATRFGDDETFDAGTGHAVTVNEVANFVNAYTENAAGIEYLPMRDGEEPTTIVAEGEGWEKLGWSPQFTWPMLTSTIDSYRPVERS